MTNSFLFCYNSNILRLTSSVSRLRLVFCLSGWRVEERPFPSSLCMGLNLFILLVPSTLFSALEAARLVLKRLLDLSFFLYSKFISSFLLSSKYVSFLRSSFSFSFTAFTFSSNFLGPEAPLLRMLISILSLEVPISFSRRTLVLA